MPSSMNEVDFAQLPRFQDRSYVPNEVDLTQKEAIVGLYQKLLDREIQSTKELENWLLDRSELEAALDQASTILYIRMTCQTDDQAKAEAYKNFIETVVPAIKPLDDQLNKKYLSLRETYPLDEKMYGIYDRSVKSDADLFREENVVLQTKVALMSQEYQKTIGAMTVKFRDQEYTLPQMSKFLYENDAALREESWRATAQRRLQDKDKLEDLFDQMLKLRHQIAKNAGSEDFCRYQFKAYHRLDYTQKDAEQYHQTMEEVVAPLWGKILERRCQQMNADKLRPWDTAVDPLGRQPLKPFEDVKDLIEGVRKIFKGMNTDLGAQYSDMADLGLLDLASRKGKAPGGYHTSLPESRKSFIFMNAVGLDDDVRTLLHESGHAFHGLAAAGLPIHDYRHAPMEFCEVASMSMELLGGEYLNVFYNDEEHKRSKARHLEDIVYVLLWVATVDAFQQWIYENPAHSREERAQKWVEIRNRFSTPHIDWSGLDEEQKYVWHRQLHIFEVPFYYIEYGIAQIGALQLWRNARSDKDKALRDYRSAIALGGSRPLPELFTSAGIKFDFSQATVQPLMELVQKEIGL